MRERLDESISQLVRVDLGGLGRNADLSVRLVRVVRGSETPYRKGWFHSGTWQPVHEADRDTVEQFLERSDVSRSAPPSATSLLGSQTLTTLGGPASQVSQVTATSRSAVQGASTRESHADSSGGRARVRRSMRRARERMAAERKAAARQAVQPPPTTVAGRQERRATQPAPPAARPGTRRSATEGLRKPVKPADIVTPILSDTSLMATFAFAHRLERAMNIGDSWFRLVLRRPLGLDAHQALQLVLQLPDGSFVQAPAKVLRVGPDRVLVEAAHADPLTLAVLRKAH